MLDSLIIILWSFCLKRLLTMKKQPVVSVRGELSQFLAYGFTFSLIMLVVFLVVWVLSI